MFRLSWQAFLDRAFLIVPEDWHFHSWNHSLGYYSESTNLGCGEYQEGKSFKIQIESCCQAGRHVEERRRSISLKRVRVLVANRPRLMRELVLATFADQPDIEIVGEVHEGQILTDIVEEARPDVLILALDNTPTIIAEIGFLLGRHPQMRILALAPEENRGAYYWAAIDIRTKPLESSEASILNAVRERPAIVGAIVS